MPSNYIEENSNQKAKKCFRTKVKTSHYNKNQESSDDSDMASNDSEENSQKSKINLKTFYFLFNVYEIHIKITSTYCLLLFVYCPPQPRPYNMYVRPSELLCTFLHCCHTCLSKIVPSWLNKGTNFKGSIQTVQINTSCHVFFWSISTKSCKYICWPHWRQL